VVLRERPFVGQILLRGDASAAAFTNRVWQVLHLDLPREQGRAIWRDDAALLWLGPDEWLAVTPDAAEAPVFCRALTDALSGEPHAVIDLSSARSVFRLSGPAAPDLLAAFCSLDLDPPAFEIGHCAQTRFGALSAILHQVEPAAAEGGPAYDLFLPRSSALSMWQEIVRAGSEHGLTVAAA
jgi:sarcosine oxidase subunit gamma